LTAVLARLLPPFVRSAATPRAGAPVPAHAEERAAVAGAGPERRQDFFAGRWCAHQALAALGADAGPVSVGARREPLWPAGVAGSITHAQGWAAAGVAWASEVWGLGIDLEALEPPLDSAVERLVLTDVERRRQAPAKIVFSAKECVFKCLFPRTRWLLEPADVAVDLDVAGGRFVAVVDGRFTGADASDRLHGRFAVAHGFILTTVCA